MLRQVAVVVRLLAFSDKFMKARQLRLLRVLAFSSFI